MKVEDFAQFLVKLDRNKASIPPKSNNSPVWEIESTTNTTHAESSVAIFLYNQGDLIASYPYLRDIPEAAQYTLGICWNGKWQWDGKAQWGNG